MVKVVVVSVGFSRCCCAVILALVKDLLPLMANGMLVPFLLIIEIPIWTHRWRMGSIWKQRPGSSGNTPKCGDNMHHSGIVQH